MAMTVGHAPVDVPTEATVVVPRGARPISFTAAQLPMRLFSGSGRLRGWGFTESTRAASAALELFDGMDAGGSLIAPIELSPGQSIRDWFGDQGIELLSGLFVRATLGAARGTLYVNPDNWGLS